LLILRMVSLTLKYGLCAGSAVGFAGYSLLLSAFLGDINGGYQFGKLALDVLDRRFNHVGAYWVPRVLIIFNGFVSPLKHPTHSCLPKLREASLGAFMSGDNENAMCGLAFFLVSSFLTGAKMKPIEKSARRDLDKMRRYKQELTVPFQLIFLETVLVLMGKDDDPLVVNGILMNDAPFPTQSNDPESRIVAFAAQTLKMSVAYILGGFHTALDMARKSLSAARVLAFGVLGFYYHFYSAMAYLASARNLPKWRRQPLSLAPVED
jgi:predicted ATPase